MPGRRLGILALLIALLSMHGIQYMSAGAHAQVTASPEHTLDAAAGTALALAPITPPDDVGTTMAPERPAAASAAATASMPGHGIPAHVWSLCLAVLLAGLALLRATVARRTAVAWVRESVSRAGGTLHRSLPPRPPDLSVLCLLRI